MLMVLYCPLVAGRCMHLTAYHWHCWWERWGWGPQRSRWDPEESPEMPECSWQHRRSTPLLSQLVNNDNNNNEKCISLANYHVRVQYAPPHWKRPASLPQIVMIMKEWHVNEGPVWNLSSNEKRSLATQWYANLRQMEPMYIYTD